MFALWQVAPPETLSEPFLGFRFREKEDAGRDIGLLACLAELRGDWAMFKDTLNLPGWQGKGTHLPQMQLHPD